MSKVWFFGDSFCDSEANWVKQVSKNLNAEIAHLGIAASSVSFLQNDLINNAHLISKNDFVIACLTNTHRFYFAGIHLDHHIVNYSAAHGENTQQVVSRHLKEVYPLLDEKQIYTKSLDITSSFNFFMKHLYDHYTYENNMCGVASHIVNDILPNLPTKKVIFFYSIRKDEYLNYPFYKQPNQITQIGFWETLLEYFLKEQGIEDIDEIIKKIHTPNHWIDDPVYEQMFWERYNPILKLIGAHTVEREYL
jgi:hypothetical protein